MDGRTDGGDCNIPNAFLKKRGDNYQLLIIIVNREDPDQTASLEAV